MNKKIVYLISWCDDNHDPFYWLDTTTLGCEMDTIVKSIIDLQLPKGTIVNPSPSKFWII